MGRCVFVLGTSTSGTELVADVLKALGMEFLKLQDAPKLIPTSGCRELVKFFEWSSCDGRCRSEIANEFVQQAKDQLNLPIFGLKEPWLCFRAEELLPFLEDTWFLFITEETKSCIRNLINESSRREEALFVQKQEALEGPRVQNLSPSLTVSVDELIEAPE